MRAQSDELLLVFFGFTSCPDICPTTMATIATALDQRPELVDEVEVAMVSVDPERDTADVMPRYVTSFVDRARALRTDDPATLRAAADAFGASYLVTTDADGEPDVGHSAYLYGVDDQGQVVVTWSFGVTADELSSDLSTLLTQS
nr:SCO family protein [Rhabdothermincola salaria]